MLLHSIIRVLDPSHLKKCGIFRALNLNFHRLVVLHIHVVLVLDTSIYIWGDSKIVTTARIKS